MASENVNIIIKAHDRTKRSFRAVTMGLNAIKKVAFSMQTALIAVGVAGFGYLVKKSMDATDALGKMADKIGIGTAELGGLRHAAELTGVATNTLDMGLQRMVRRISEAASGSGEAKDALIELGLSAKALNDLSPDQQFRAIADAMEGVAGQGEKVRLAMRLFDTEGVALVNTLKGGSAALIAMEQDAERLGLRLSRGLVKGVEKANDAITILSSYIATLFHRMVGELSPAIEAITIKIREWVEATVQAAGGPKQFAKDMALAFLDAGKAIIITTSTMLNSVVMVANTAGQAVQSLLDLLPSSLPTLNELSQTMAVYEKQLENLNKQENTSNRIKQASISNARKQLNIIKEQINLGEYAAEFKNIELFNFQGSLDQIDRLSLKLKAVALGDQTITAAKNADDKRIELQKKTNARLLTMRQKHFDSIQMAQTRYQAQQEENKKNELEVAHLYLKKQTAIQKASYDALKNKSTTITEDIIEAYKSTTDSIENTLTDAMMGTKSWGEAMKDIFREVAREYVLTNIARPFIKSITSALPTFDGGGFTGGGSRSGGVDGKGGFNAVLHPNETVIDHTKQQGNGSSTNISFNIQANDARGFDQLLQERRGQIVGMINQAMNENGQRAIA